MRPAATQSILEEERFRKGEHQKKRLALSKELHRATQQQEQQEQKREEQRTKRNATKRAAYNSKAFVCRHCKEEGHDYINMASCANSCQHCNSTDHSLKTCALRIRDVELNTKTNEDAARYAAAIAETMIFHSCGICDREFGLSQMVPLDTIQDVIARSGLKTKFDALVAPMHDSNAHRSARAYATAVHLELDDGVRRGAHYACEECTTQLRRRPSATHQPDTAVPDFALVNGYFRGQCPPQLQNLTRVDLSMIGLINVMATIVMLPYKIHFASNATVYCVLNDVVDIASSLPRDVKDGDIATVIRAASTRSPRQLTYNPKRVLEALRWLEANNELYDGMLQLPRTHDGRVESHWIDDGVNADIEVPHIEADLVDFEGIGEESTEHPAGTDGHAVNPGAPRSDCTEVYFYQPRSSGQIQQMAEVSVPDHSPAVVTVRSRGEFTADYKTTCFMQKAFPQLYPYGRGGPGQGPVMNAAYFSYALHLGGDRIFQQCPRFIFYAYTWVMRKQMGTIAWLASRSATGEPDAFTKEDALALLGELSTSQDPNSGAVTSPLFTQGKIRALAHRLQPYVQSVPGTEMYFSKERQKLLAMISSPATTSLGQWTWFFTEAQPDMFLPEIYDNAVTSWIGAPQHIKIGTVADRQAYCDTLTAKQRAHMLQCHPFMSARVHSLQQLAYWDCILQGARKPLGDIADYWMRVEFQMKGTPHWHTMINIRKDSMPGILSSSASSSCPEERRRVEDLVTSVATAKLLERHQDDNSDLADDGTREYRKEQELTWDYNLDRPKYFRDVDHPARRRFSASSIPDYSINSATGHIADAGVRQQYRRLQLANQMHTCRDSCYKYCRKNQPQTCRYGFTRERLPENDHRSTIVVDKDKRGRVRTRVLPPRNNGNINQHLRNPLCYIASRGNQDIQYIQNTTGGAEYCSKYCSKAEAAESTAMLNAINRKIAQKALQLQDGESLNLRCRLEAVGSALIGAQQVGAVQACYVLGKLPLVKSSRETVSVNCLRRSDLSSRPIILSEDELNELDSDASALSTSPTTQMGKRDTYHLLYKQQLRTYGSVQVNFFAFLSCYSVKRAPPHCRTPSGPSTHLLLDEFGFIIKPESFVLEKVLFTAMKKPAVLCLCPKTPIDEENEKSAFSIILLYGDWGEGGEESLTAETTAVEKLKSIRSSLPEHVVRSLAQVKHSEKIIGNIGEPELADDIAPALFGAIGGEGDTSAGYEDDRFTNVQQLPLAVDNERVIRHASVNHMAYLHSFIKSIETQLAMDSASANTMTAEERAQKALDPTTTIAVPRADEKSDLLEGIISKLNAQQLRGFAVATDHISGRVLRQLILFLSGEGGTGKSWVIDAVTLFTQLLIGKTEGSWGAVLKTAPTGGAAHNIGGSTWHSALNKSTTGRNIGAQELSPASVANLQRKGQGTVLFVMDEVSLLSCEELYDVSLRLGAATGKMKEPFGGLHALLVGDFYQMRPVGGTPLVQVHIAPRNIAATQGRKLFVEAVNSYVLLVQNVRAQSQNGTLSPLAAFTTRARIGDVAGALVLTMNDRIRNTMDCAAQEAHPRALWITSTHNKIAVINRFFEDRRLEANEPMFKVIARHVPSKAGVPALTPAIRRKLYADKGDRKGQRGTLMLSHFNLFIGSRVRLTRNLFVEGGLYNGAMGTVWGFVFCGSGDMVPEIDGTKRLFGDMDDREREIPVVLVQMDGDESSFPYSCSTHVPRLVPITEIQSSSLVCGEYKRLQLPILPAEARTAHSVQGYTARDGVVVEPGSAFFAGDYTAISRAQSKEKVILLAGLQAKYFAGDDHADYRAAVASEYKRLLTLFPQH